MTAGIAFAEETANEPVELDATRQLQLQEKQLQGEQSQKCVMICEQWGEDCVINPRTGSKKCRRTCKQLGQECY